MNPKVAAIFSGQGSQQIGMGRELAEMWPAFRDALERTWTAVDAHLDIPLREVMWAGADTPQAKLLDQTTYTQPALFSFQVALWALWRSWGMEPGLVAGHSIGELSAAHVAGIFSLDDAARLVAARGRLMGELPSGGAMVAVAAPEAEVAAAVAAHASVVSIAAINAPSSVAISGDEAAVLAIAERFASRGVRTKRLVVSHAFHSPRMDAALEPLRRVAETVTYHAPRLRIASNVSGSLDESALTTPAYWASHVRQPVRFAANVLALHNAGAQQFVEISPKPMLVNLVAECLPAVSPDALVASLRPGRHEGEAIKDARARFDAAPRERMNGALEKTESVTFANSMHRVEWPVAAASSRPVIGAVNGAAGALEGRWVVVAEQEDALGRALARRLEAAGTMCTVTSFARLDDALPADHVVCIWPRAAADTMAKTPETTLQLATDAIAIVRRLATEQARLPRLVWVTAGAVAVTSGEPVPAVACSALWGLGRTVRQEHPQLRCRLVDVGPDGTSANSDREIDALVDELRLADDETEIAWRDGQRHVARLVRAPAANVPATENYALEISRPGRLETPTVVDAPRSPLRDGEVEIGVRASGITFRDVLATLGNGDGASGASVAPLGRECAGIVTAVGTGVARVAVGDKVMALATGSFRRFVTVDERRVAPVPAGLSFEQAAAIPVAFLTAWYALHDLAGLEKGERLLVHAAAGGVGMAAAQLGRWMGAEVYATASPSKWPVVRALGIGQVASSRDLAFVDAFREASAGAGVDVVLNPLAGDFVDASASLVRAGGRFIELGTTDVRDASAMSARYPATTYRALDLADVGPQRIEQMLEAVARGLAAGDLRPLPIRTFDVTQAHEAFRTLGQGRNVGKLVLSASRTLRTDGTVLITGGLGLLGIETAQCLARRGVRHLLLTSRKGKDTPGADDAVAFLEKLGARVTVTSLDVADRQSVASVLAAIPADLPLRGVVHAAGIFDDALLAEQTPEALARVMAAKVEGGWNLHESTRAMDLDVFLLFASTSGTLGWAGHGAYAAANAFLDGLSAHRRAQGLPAQSLAWGLWNDASGGAGGMAAVLDQAQADRVTRTGMRVVSPGQGRGLLEEALGRPDAQLVPVPIDLDEARAAFAGAVPPLWRALVRPSRKASRKAGGWSRNLHALAPEERAAAVLEIVRTEVARALALGGPGEVEPDRPLKALGLDSLAAVELRAALARGAGGELPANIAFEEGTAEALAQYLITRFFDSLSGAPPS